jgi:hypothetical protein
MKSKEQITEKASKVQPVERIRLVEVILNSPDKINPEIEQK